MVPQIFDVSEKNIDAIERMITKVTGGAFLMDMVETDDEESIEEECARTTRPQHCCRRRVSFSDNLIRDVWERPKTTAEEKGLLFYTAREFALFRYEYRLFLRQALAISRAKDEATASQQQQQQLKAASHDQNNNNTGASPISSYSLSSWYERAKHIANSLSHVEHHQPMEAMLIVDTLYLF